MDIKLDYFEFFDKYKPIVNPFDSNAAENGCLFETYGAELQMVKDAEPNKVWTLVTDDNGETIIVNGAHFVNRLGYLITQEPFDQNSNIIVD